MLAGLVACGGASPKVPHNPAVELDLVRRSGRGPSVAVLPRPSGQLVRLALWIDAGSRDAQPPQVATLAAWLAVEAAGGNARAHVEPEGTELALWCAREQLPSCLAALRRGLALRAPSTARLEAARARLIAARRRAEAVDPGRGADRLALQALYGEAANGLLPLGAARDDAAASGAAIKAFLGDHYGPSRALLVAVGEVEERELIDQAARALGGAPQARAARATRSGPGAGGVRADVDAQSAITVALAGNDLTAVHAAATAMRARLAREGLQARAGASSGMGYALRLRGHALALLRVRADDPEAAARAIGHELDQLRGEGLPEAPLEPRQETPSALARRLGSRWAAHGAKANAGELSAGLGVQVAGGRGDRLGQSDPDAATREQASSALASAWQQGRAQAAPETDTSQRDGTLSATLENAARIELRAQPGERVAVAVRFGAGAAADPPALHGRAALLASTATSACAGLSVEQLAARLLELGAELEPQVDAEGWGLLLTAPAQDWQPAVALALDCALSPALERKSLSAGRLRLLARLGPTGGAGELRAEVAGLVAPATPGQLAPWGHPAHQASVSLADVRELWRSSRHGRGLTVGVAGPVPSEQALGWIARRLAPLPEQVPAPKAVAETGRARVSARPHESRAELAQPTLGLALWQVDLQRAGPEGAQAFAALMRAALAQIPGATAIWHDGGAQLGAGWAAVAVTAPPERLPIVADALRTLGRTLPAERLTHAADAAVALAREHDAERAGTAAASAAALASATTPPTSDAASARELAKRLATSEPRFIALR
ncbi:MAG TPA: insulinase family protein [Polyangiales bacterium]|nr:insulinase family protein [Polyangiales bacterium]